MKGWIEFRCTIELNWRGYLYIAFHQFSDPISKRFTVYTFHISTNGLPTWVEQSKDTYSWSTSSFPTIIYSATFISFLTLSSIFFFPLPTYFHFHFYCACWVSVRNQHSLNTNYYGTTFGGMQGVFFLNSVPDLF